MGNSFPITDNNYYIYKRIASTDVWDIAPALTMKTSKIEALSAFKHEVYCFGLGNSKYIDTKAIYLYHGKTRISKAVMNSENKQLEIWSTAVRQYIRCDEKSQQTGKTIKYERLFQNKFQENFVWINSQKIGFALIK
jgi:hypothetical protein|tara:strand:- start:1416 stop:1826 length:411 start_codon:yes stop_codon:yes gene_type:complete